MSLAHHKFVEMLGEADALRFFELYGGTQLYVPVGPNVGSLSISREISPGAEVALAREFGGMLLRVPLCKAWRAQLYREAGLKQREIARRLGCNERTVLKLLKVRLNDLQTTHDTAPNQMALPL